MLTDSDRKVIVAADWLESVWKGGTRKAIAEAEQALAMAVRNRRAELAKPKPAAE